MSPVPKTGLYLAPPMISSSRLSSPVRQWNILTTLAVAFAAYAALAVRMRYADFADMTKPLVGHFGERLSH